MEPEKKDIDKDLAEQFKSLPKVVQDAITSADVQEHMRALAEKHQLHVDQWELLENEVMLTLLGLEPIEKIAENIKNEVGVPQDVAAALAADISKIVFEPIRGELERSLGGPDAKEVATTPVEQARAQILSQERPVPVSAATPPIPVPTDKAVRVPISESYKAGEASTNRKSIHDDPYREPPA